MTSKDAAVLMSRIPVSGRTKTRLARPPITAEHAANLHCQFLKDLNDTLARLPISVDRFLFFGREGPVEQASRYFPENVSRLPQPAGDLGFRMRFAFEALFAQGYDKVVLFGSDVPQLSSLYIQKALDSLDNNDLVFGPTYDGGYYLIAMRKLLEEPFSSTIHWGSATVFSESLSALRHNYRVSLLSSLRDIDELDDLQRVYHELKLGDICPHTRAYVAQHFKEFEHE